MRPAGVTRSIGRSSAANATWQRDLIVSNFKLAGIAGEDRQRAAMHYAAALMIARQLADTGRLAPVDAWMVDDLTRRLAAAASPEADPTEEHRGGP